MTSERAEVIMKLAEARRVLAEGRDNGARKYTRGQQIAFGLEAVTRAMQFISEEGEAFERFIKDHD